MDTSTHTAALDNETLQLFTDSVERYGADKYGFDNYRAWLRSAPGFSQQAWGWLGQGWASLPGARAWGGGTAGGGMGADRAAHQGGADTHQQGRAPRATVCLP